MAARADHSCVEAGSQSFAAVVRNPAVGMGAEYTPVGAAFALGIRFGWLGSNRTYDIPVENNQEVGSPVVPLTVQTGTHMQVPLEVNVYRSSFCFRNASREYFILECVLLLNAYNFDQSVIYALLLCWKN